MPFISPLGTGTRVGAKKARGQRVHVESRAGNIRDSIETQADLSAVQNLCDVLGQRSEVLHEPVPTISPRATPEKGVSGKHREQGISRRGGDVHGDRFPWGYQ